MSIFELVYHVTLARQLFANTICSSVAVSAGDMLDEFDI
jgi:hypothetical protein